MTQITEDIPSVDILILDAGWVSTFLIPLLTSPKHGLTYAATSRSGRDGTIPLTFDPDYEDYESYRTLPDAMTVVITFPITQEGAVRRLVRMYRHTR
jgi:hypothetical protein